MVLCPQRESCSPKETRGCHGRNRTQDWINVSDAGHIPKASQSGDEPPLHSFDGRLFSLWRICHRAACGVLHSWQSGERSRAATICACSRILWVCSWHEGLGDRRSSSSQWATMTNILLIRSWESMQWGWFKVARLLPSNESASMAAKVARGRRSVYGTSGGRAVLRRAERLPLDT